MESHRTLYLELAAEHRVKAETMFEPGAREIMLRAAESYEAAADAIEIYPDAEA